MLQWEIDRTLGELEALYGFERAAGIYRRSGACVAGLAKLIAAHGITCGFQPRNTLYLANNHEGARELMEERQLRRRAGLPGHYLEHPDLLTQYEFDRDAAILSPGSAEADPLLLTWALLRIAFSRGARLINASVTRLHSEGGHVTAETNGAHVIEARHVVLATGYSMPGLDMPKLHRTSSSWALATLPQKPDDLWRDGMLLWEDSHPYLYVRTTTDNRIIAGGEDDDTTDPEERDRKLPGKVMAIREKLKRLWPKADTRVEHAWCGTFGETADGLPLIGPVPGMAGVYAAYGYGGNGITFSYLAAQMIGAMLAGMYRDWFEDFALDRDAPTVRSFMADLDTGRRRTEVSSISLFSRNFGAKPLHTFAGIALLRRLVVARIGNILQPDELRTLCLEIDECLGDTLAGRMRRLVDVGDDDVAVLGRGNALFGDRGTEQRTTVAIHGIAGDAVAHGADLADSREIIFGGRATEPAGRRNA